MVLDWLVEPSLHRVSRAGTSLRLEPKVMQVLLCLAERAGEVVSKEELIGKVWAGGFVSDQVLTNAISDLRQAFQRGRDAEFIQTIPKGGYRLVAQVVVGAAPAPQAKPRPSAPGRRGVSSRGLRVTLAALALVALGVGGTALVLRFRSTPAAPEPRIRSVVVLPLANLSGDPGQEYFADGMTEELIGELAKIRGLRVISRTSAMTYKGTRKQLPEIARELGVDGVVEGSVTRAGSRVRITAQLIHGSEGHLWADSYERDLADVLGLQRDVARAIARRIRVELRPEEEARPREPRAVDPAAHEAYLMGRFYAGKWSAATLPRALGSFSKAIALDPDYALAHAGLGYGYFLCALACPAPDRAAARAMMGKARSAAGRAVAIDDGLAEAHAMLGNAEWFYSWNWIAVESELRRAMELAPDSVEVLLHRGLYLTNTGRHAEAVATLERVVVLDPLSLEARLFFGSVLRNAGDHRRGIAELSKALELDPGSQRAHEALATLYDLAGKPAEAAAAARQARRLAGARPAELDALDRAYAAYGYAGIVRLQLERLKASKGASPQAVAAVLARLGDRDAALRTLEAACRERDITLLGIAVDPRLAPLRADRRFVELLRHIGFPSSGL